MRNSLIRTRGVRIAAAEVGPLGRPLLLGGTDERTAVPAAEVLRITDSTAEVLVRCSCGEELLLHCRLEESAASRPSPDGGRQPSGSCGGSPVGCGHESHSDQGDVT